MATWKIMEEVCKLVKDKSEKELQELYKRMSFSESINFATIMKNRYKKNVSC